MRMQQAAQLETEVDELRRQASASASAGAGDAADGPGAISEASLAELDAEHAANPGRTGTVGRRWTPTGTSGAAEHEVACPEPCARGRLLETTGTRLHPAAARSPPRLALTIDIDAPHGGVDVGLSLHTLLTIY